MLCYLTYPKRGRPGTTPSGRVPLTNRPGGCGKFLANLLPIEPSVPENRHITCCWGLDRERTIRARPPDARLLLFPHPVSHYACRKICVEYENVKRCFAARRLHIQA